MRGSVSGLSGKKAGPSLVPVASRLKGEFSKVNVALRIIAFYLASGAAWEFALQDLMPFGPERFWDFAFVVVWAGPLYLFIDRALESVSRKNAELHDARMRHASILEANPCGIILIDRAGRFAYANPGSENILGVERGELVGGSCADLPLGAMTAEGEPIPRESRPTNRALEAGQASHGVELGWTRPDGARIVLSLDAVPLFDAHGAVDGVVASFVDVTERRRADALIRRKLSLAVEQGPAGIMITDRARKVEYVNPAYTRMTGYEAAEVIGTRAETAVERCSGPAARATALIAAGVEWREVSEGRRKSGEPYWESVSISPIRDSDGAITHFLWVREDVTERRRAEHALREQEERFRQIFEQDEDPVIVVAPGSAQIRDANPAAVALFGYSRDELVSKGLALVTGPETCAELEERIRAIDDGGRLALPRVPCTRKNGERVFVCLGGKSIRTARGGRYAHCTLRDITDRVRIEEEAKSQNAQLIHANRMASLGTVASGVAHEINNPNNLIMFNAPMIHAAWLDAVPILEERFRRAGEFPLGGLSYSEMREIVPKLLAGLSDASLRIKGIVSTLKEFARPDGAGGEALVDVAAAIRSSVAILNHEILKGCADFRVETNDSLPRIRGNARQLEQVIVNLVLNALQALPDKRRGIRVSASAGPGGGSVEICIADGGRGMSAEVMSRLTEPFFTTRPDAGGLGLGLSISSSIVKAHGGMITFESEVGRGTTACIRLPAADAAALPGRRPGASAECR